MTLSPAERTAEEQAVRLGLACAIGAYLLWGLFPIYFRFLASVGAMEILAHRIVWSMPFGALVLTLRRQWGDVAKAFATPKVVMMLGISAVFISVNWLIYVWAVTHERVLEASLGYYINPLMVIAAGVFVLGEKLRPLQIAAVGAALAGVVALVIGTGVVPWVSLTLAASFTIYGYVRKTTNVGAMPGLFVEVCLLAPAALAYLAFLAHTGAAVFATGDVSRDALLVISGPLTVVPLVLFALAARRLKMSTLGFLQYLGPSLQFAIGIAFGEAFTPAHAFCFGLIWTALALVSFDAVRAGEADRRSRAALNPVANPVVSASPKSS